MAEPKRLLFVCIENANRSQMAQAFARMHGGDAVEAYSAGSRPGQQINPKAVDAMAERGYDLNTHQQTSIHDLPNVRFDAVATMGCGDACPAVPADIRAEWEIPDPRDMPPEKFREVRDLVERKVKDLLQHLGVPTDENP